MKTELLDEALSTIRAAGFEPSVVCNRHWKMSWTDRHGRTHRLMIVPSPSDRPAQSRAVLRRLLRTAP
jgi:hypothetical protein